MLAKWLVTALKSWEAPLPPVAVTGEINASVVLLPNEISNQAAPCSRGAALQGRDSGGSLCFKHLQGPCLLPELLYARPLPQALALN